MLNPDPNCVYIRPEDLKMCIAKSNLDKHKKDQLVAMQAISKHKVDIAFLHSKVPLSNNTHCIYKLFSPELLHTTVECLIKYVFISLAKQLIGTNTVGEETIVAMDRIHVQLCRDLIHNSERDFPRGLTRLGLMSKKQVSAAERLGNLFRLLCSCHTTKACGLLTPLLAKHNLSMVELIKFLKLYLSMEAWFHCNNPKTKVRSARPLIAEVIRTMTNMFPRNGQGWHISKVHGLTKMQHYTVQFGSGIKFHSGRGEANHKWLVKDTGNNTQQRPASFTS